MKFQSTITFALSASAALALSIPKRELDVPTPTAEQLFTVELAPGETKQVTEAQKWELHNVRLIRAFDEIYLIDGRRVFTSWTSLTIVNFTKHH
jgi:hypothetical protein